MAIEVDNRREEIIHFLKEYLKDRITGKQTLDLLVSFANRYYATCSIADLYERSLENLAGAFWSHWNFIYQRKPGEAKVRIFNPTLEKDGWVSTHTIIEVSHDDIPFLVDSIRMEINRNGLQAHFAIHFGGLKVVRDKNNCITDILPLGAKNAEATSEAPIYFEVDHQIDPQVMESLQLEIERVLADVRLSVGDWQKMVARVQEALTELEQNPPPLDVAEIDESKDFLHWLINNNFTFLGSRDYNLIGDGVNRALQVVPGSGLGVLRIDETTQASRRYADLPPQARKLALSKTILIIAKTNTISTVHRSSYTDYIGVKRFNEKGELIGERRFVGLYTSTAYHASPRHIPFLRHKVVKVLQDLHFPPDSHNGKEALNILESLPRDDLFQATHEELYELTLGILHLQERKRIRLLVRKDSYGRFFSCLVYVPRDNFNTELALSMQEVLIKAFQGQSSSFTTYFSDSVLARIHFIVRVNPKVPVEYDVKKIEKELMMVARSWSDELKTDLITEFGEAVGLQYYTIYSKAFPASYTEHYSPTIAITDIRKIETLSQANPLCMTFSKVGLRSIRLKLFHAEQTIPLSDVLPTLENMGLHVIGERPHEIVFKDGKVIWINDFDMILLKEKEIDITKISDIFQEAFLRIWSRDAEDDGLNRLVLAAEMTWRETVILRAYVKYLRQIGFTFSQAYVEEALTNNSMIAKDLVSLFELRFSPLHSGATEGVSSLVNKIENALESVVSLDEDRIVRRLLEVILATTRTNFYQTTKEGYAKPYISVKFDPKAISDLPLPRPMFEIFVYSPRVEGVHLRSGKVARGGLRWSDRREDFRTEILGLMKAQQVKNTVIVPVGAKGGFFPKQLPDGDRDNIMNEAIACYSFFIRGLLDITDNIRDNEIIPPKDVVRYDGDDPYLVVAADKGTATFSDIANAIALEYQFWLGDAFASGGSAGYDHKKMGITARGVWVSVKRHFRELGRNPETEETTVIGIGDMSGDVFGNGLLQSKKLKLLAAYNHQHIFLDPNPHLEKSFAERERLFNLPRSTWADYNPELISAGGGVFNRSLKSITISPEVQAALGIQESHMIPNDLIRAILKSSVDLIWNGGIGTYVKASSESHADVGDRNNDNIRVDGNELNALVIAEGGNLGLTQLGRVEYALKGGILYTDFIDNSGGVDCSDHEVNIKIVLNKLVSDQLLTHEDRNKLLESMTNEVAELVLRNNYEQTQMLSLESSVAPETLDLFRRYMNELEKTGRINRSLEFLPDEKKLIDRKSNGKHLTRPEIAILLAYTKMYLKQDILASDLPEHPYFVRHLLVAFPETLQKKYLAQLKEHSLRREIIATQLSKNITDHMGIYFVERLQRETGAPVAFIVRAYAVVESIFNMNDMWTQIEKLDYKIEAVLQQKMMLQVYYLIRRTTRWFIRNRKADLDIEGTIADFSQPIKALTQQLMEVLPDPEALANEIKSLMEQGVPQVLATQIASCNILFTSLDIVEGTRKYHFDLADMAKTYYALDTKLELNWLREQMNAYPIESQWDELARSAFRDDLDKAQRKLSVSVLTFRAKKLHDKTISERIDAWLKQHKFLMQRWRNLLAEIKSAPSVGFVTYSVVLRELFDFAQAE